MENHWTNEVTTLQYIEKILLPYVTKTRKKQNLHSNQCCVVIFDTFKAQCITTVLQVLEENILVALVPPHCTDRLQPLDIAVNKSVREFWRAEFHDWYSTLVCRQLEENNDVQPVDLHLTIVKPLSATWTKNLMDYLQLQPEFAINDFCKAGKAGLLRLFVVNM